MKMFVYATVVAGALGAAAIGLAAQTVAAPSGPGNAEETISRLEDRGYRVIVKHNGNVGPLNEADVVSVRYGDNQRVYVTVR